MQPVMWQRKRAAAEEAAQRHGSGAFRSRTVRGELIARDRDVKKLHAVHFMATPVSVTDAAKDFYVSD